MEGQDGDGVVARRVPQLVEDLLDPLSDFAAVQLVSALAALRSKLPWRRDEDSWAIDADVGRVSAGLDEDEEVLTFSQMISQVQKADKKNGEFYGALLRDNLTVAGACFALMDLEEGEPPHLFVVGRIASASLDPEEVALALQSVFSLSAMFD